MYEEAIPFDGRIERPLVTLHGSWLVQRIVRSPGHCNFSASEQADAFDALVAWARNGKHPDGDNVLGDLTDAGTKFTTPLRPGDPGMIRVSIGSKDQ